MTEEAQETLPIENTPPPPAAPPAEPEVIAAEPEPAPEPEPQPEPEPKKQPWFLQRISEESAKRSAAEQRAIDAERRARAAEELLQRERPEQRTAPQPLPLTIDDQSRQEEIRREAARLRFQEDIGELNANGLRAYGAEFDNAVNVLASVTGQGEPLFEFVADVMSIDKANAHALLHALGTKPEEAAIFARMNSKQRIAALTRMSMTAAPEPKAAPAPATKQVSKAPAPAPALQPTAHKIINFQSPDSDKLTDKEFFAQLDEHMQKSGRHARR